ncbi:unnamed protein product [Mycena citricolor]|uniref:RecA family profile 1 domain-containing protein n=1 Tax=Mycena citricolor TaxID=2018698 RepID=A0AAD2HR60_9AGAR|nr:unnamed protein product [Mycena citricolor]
MEPLDSVALANAPYLTFYQKTALKKGNVLTVSNLILLSVPDLGRRCRISPLEAKAILEVVCLNSAPRAVSLEESSNVEQMISTGDSQIDTALGGGIRTGMVWEVFGESAAGKTQLALQLSLLVQTPPSTGGVTGSACYISLSAQSRLQTSRLKQMLDARPDLSLEVCGLDDIHTIKSPTIPFLIQILSKILPDLIAQRAASPGCKPVKLVVLDALAELFHTSDKTSTTTLVERAQSVVEISSLLHSLASEHNVAVLVLNEVTDVFSHEDAELEFFGAELGYRQQARWFGTSASILGQNRKEAQLGLVWANQVNARIMLSRTGRRRYLHTVQSAKFSKSADGRPLAQPTETVEDSAVLIRRLSVIFSSVGPPCSLDFIVAEAGICALHDDEDLDQAQQTTGPISDVTVAGLSHFKIDPLDIASSAEDMLQTEDADDLYWDNFPEPDSDLIQQETLE